MRIKGVGNKNFVICVCSQLPTQHDGMGELFYRQVGEFSGSPVLILTGDFNFPGTNWEYHTDSTSKAGKYLKHAEDNFLSQVLSELTRRGFLPDLLFENKGGLGVEVMVGGCLGHSDHGLVEFQILGVRRKKCEQSCHPRL